MWQPERADSRGAHTEAATVLAHEIRSKREA